MAGNFRSPTNQCTGLMVFRSSRWIFDGGYVSLLATMGFQAYLTKITKITKIMKINTMVMLMRKIRKVQGRNQKNNNNFKNRKKFLRTRIQSQANLTVIQKVTFPVTDNNPNYNSRFVNDRASTKRKEIGVSGIPYCFMNSSISQSNRLLIRRIRLLIDSNEMFRNYRNRMFIDLILELLYLLILELILVQLKTLTFGSRALLGVVL